MLRTVTEGPYLDDEPAVLGSIAFNGVVDVDRVGAFVEYKLAMADHIRVHPKSHFTSRVLEQLRRELWYFMEILRFTRQQHQRYSLLSLLERFRALSRNSASLTRE